MVASDAHRAIDAVWRIEAPRLIAGLTRILRDVGLAEDLAQDALVAALEQWPREGVPNNPGAWLMATARHRAINLFRRNKRLQSKLDEIGRDLDLEHGAVFPDFDAALDDDVGDDLLRLMFIACHPVLSPEARVALTLRLLGGLTTDEIARAFLVPERLPSPSASFAPSGPWGPPASRSRSRRRPSSPNASSPCSKSSTWSSMRATPPPLATTGCGRRSATTP